MIAASDPQEFISSGRQQIAYHPGPLQLADKEKSPDELLRELEKVSLTEKRENGWWILRKSPPVFKDEEKKDKECSRATKCMNCQYPNKTQYSEQMEETGGSFKDNSASRLSKRTSDANNRFPNKRISLDSDKSRASSCITPCRSQNGKPSTEPTEVFSKVEPGYMEDELFVKGQTAIWSRGLVNDLDSSDNGRKIISCYTVQNPIKQALWCTFYCERPTYDQALLDIVSKTDQPCGTPVEAICLIDTNNIQVFSTKGEKYAIAVPFKIRNVWNIRFGIFVEKDEDGGFKECFQKQTGNLFSLAYPLDDLCPVATSQNSIISVLSNPNIQVVYTNENPSICMIYDTTTKCHSVYKIRKLKLEEKDYGDKGQSTFHSITSTSNMLKSKLSVLDNLVSKSNTRMVTPKPSPVQKKPTSVPRLNLVQKSNSCVSMAAMSRCQSPASSVSASPWTDVFQKGNKTSHVTKSFFDCSKSMSHTRSDPNICLEHLWSDNYSMQEQSTASAATKVFICDDLVGQTYLCYILPSRLQLSIVKADFTYPMTFGILTSIGAKDAVPIPHLHMLAILEHTGNVTLYSGLTMVGKLHMGGTLAQHMPSPMVRRMHYFNSPFPRRSSLLPQANQLEPKFDEHLLSPVLPPTPAMNPPKTPRNLKLPHQDPKKVSLSGLMDATGNRITLKYSDGTFYRIILPIIASSSLVESCLLALRQCLPRDAALVLFARWYSTRNVIGAEDTSANEEWELFTNLLYELCGFDSEIMDEADKDMAETSVKKQKSAKCASDDDWEYLLNSNHQCVNSDFGKVLKMNFAHGSSTTSVNQKVVVNSKSVLFPHLRVIHFMLHLLYEDLKLNTLRTKELLPLMKFLNKLALDLNLEGYCVYYWKDFPETAVVSNYGIHIAENDLNQMNSVSYLATKPISVMQHIYDLLNGHVLEPYPYMASVNQRSRDIVQLCGVLSQAHKNIPAEVQLHSFIQDFANAEIQHQKSVILDGSTIEQVVLLMVEMKITTRYIETLPVGIYYLLYNVLWQCRENPPSDWPSEAYQLIWRDDLVAQAQKHEMEKDKFFQEKMNICYQLQESVPNTKQEILDLDGMEDIDSTLTRMIFSEDMRVAEARKMLASSKPVPIVLTQRPDVSDHDFIEEQEKHLYGLCIRTMALPVGRGMFTLRTTTPIITEPLAAPALCLTGKAPPRGATIDLNHIDTPANMNLWPLFHNGVANGLRVTPEAQNIDSTWIIFNKPKGGVEPQMEHAGFLMALGLNGHLRNLAILSTFDYLGKLHEMTSVGILLGLSSAFRGTSHQGLTKILAIHVEAMLPPTSMELDVPQNLQVAGLLGIGLVYMRTAHRHITEVLLSEIGRPPGPEMENSVDRESYSLSAGLALGLVTLKHGGHPAGLSDLNVPDTLHYYMVGGNRRPLTGSQKDKYKTPSFQIREGSHVNLDVTAPGATLALGLMYLGTGNKAVADWMAPPTTQYLLDFVRPDFLMLRILARSLILWDSIEPSREWVESQVPSSILAYCMVKPSNAVDVDYEAMNQAYCNIVAGSCFALGLRFAGSADKDAFETLLFFCHMFTSLTGKSIAELAGKATIETCLNVVLLSASMVMAGTGNLEIMRLIRHLRRRVGTSNSAIVTYGSHLAIHMALGLLFLGGGRYTLSNTPASIAALICAFYPKFPTHSNDNRYHLQAFRHLYVLAVEPRLLIPKDVMSDEICYANLRIVKLDCTSLTIKGPGLIPDLNTLLKVTVDDERYWPVVFEKGRNWELLMKILSTTGYVEVKQRAGCLSYMTDKMGYHSQLARTLTQSNVIPWDPSALNVVSFTSDECLKKFCDNVLTNEKEKCSEFENKLTQMLTKVTYEAVVKDKLIVIPMFASLLKTVLEFNSHPSTYHLWQLKLIRTQVLSNKYTSNLITKETLLALQQEIATCFDAWEDQLKPYLRRYLQGQDFNVDKLKTHLAAYIIYYEIPYKIEIKDAECMPLLMLLEKARMNVESVNKIARIFE